MNLCEALHVLKLRPSSQGYPDYRFICSEMWRKIQEVPPALAETGKFIDWQNYRLGGLQPNRRTEFKKSGMRCYESCPPFKISWARCCGVGPAQDLDSTT